LSLDAIAFHELTGVLMKKVLTAKGVLRFSWIAWGMVLVAILGLAYLKFIIALPPRRRRQFLVAGGLFVFAAVMMEMVGGKLMDYHRTRDAIPYLVESHIEELLEMLAIALFNGALVEHLGALTGGAGLTVQFSSHSPSHVPSSADGRRLRG
jgi:hypothetical protein